MNAQLRRAAMGFFVASGPAAFLLSGPPASGTSTALSVRIATLEEALRSLPGRNLGSGGLPGDALNLVFVGAEEKLIEALGAAGWTRVPRTISGSIAEGLAELARGRWPAAFPPMHLHRLFGRIQDHNFAIPTLFPHSRHHFRLWRSPFADAKGRHVWWGSADYDVAIRWSDLSHVSAPDTDRERDFVAATLADRARLDWIRLPQIPREGENDRGHPFRNDGRALLVEL